MIEPTIKLSTAVSENKATTNGYKIVELQTLQELLHTMNREAVASGLFSNGHREGNHLRAMGNVYFIDIDTAPSTDENPYYQIIEDKLRQLNISFVSVPSKSANQYSYKRHIAVILSHSTPVSKKAFKQTAEYILSSIGVDVEKIDKRVAFNNISFLAPASINKHFRNYDEVSNLYEGNPLVIPHHNAEDKIIKENIASNAMIHFSDGSILSAYQAKKIIGAGDKKSCYCPKHDDNNPSATFYHNSNGKVNIFCGKCGDIGIDTNFIPTEPTITHEEYGYSIILQDVPQAKIRALVSKIGNYSYQEGRSVIWVYSVESISDIYQLLLAKIYLVQKGFSVSPLPTDKKYDNLLSTATLRPIIKNVTLPTPYIPKEVAKSEAYYQHKQIACLVFEHYLFVETTIYATYQNIIKQHRIFDETCNVGLAYFEYVLRVIEDEKRLKQSSKRYPLRVKKKDKMKLTEERGKNMKKGKDIVMTTRQRKVLKLLSDENYLKSNGKPNLTAIAKKLSIYRTTLYRDIERINKRARI